MADDDFETRAERTLAAIEQALEASGADVDSELKPGGVLELDFADGSKIVINRHSAAREIWVAARSGGFHYRWDGAAWRDTRDSSELFASLSRLVSAQGGRGVVLAGRIAGSG
jgi:CyaY protein